MGDISGKTGLDGLGRTHGVNVQHARDSDILLIFQSKILQKINDILTDTLNKIRRVPWPKNLVEQYLIHFFV